MLVPWVNPVIAPVDAFTTDTTEDRTVVEPVIVAGIPVPYASVIPYTWTSSSTRGRLAIEFK